MTHTLRASCRPLTYVLCFLLIPLVVVYGPARPAQAAVVAIGPTVSVEVQTSNVFPGQAVKCSVTGYTRLHDTNLHSVRATVRCSYGFGREDLDRASLTARDADTSESNTCRFHQEDFTLIESTDTETTLTYNLSNPTLPDSSCNLTTGVLHLQGSGGSFGRSPETFVFAWPLGALPQQAASGPGAPLSCDGLADISSPYWSNIRQAQGTPTSSTDRVVRVDSPFMFHTSAGSTGPGTLHYYYVFRGHVTVANGGNVTPYSGVGLFWEKPTGGWHEGLGGPLFVMRSRVQISNTASFVPGTAGITVDPFLALSRYQDRSANPVPQKYDLVGAGYWYKKGVSETQPGEPLHVAGLQESVAGSMYGVTKPSACRWYFGPKIVREPLPDNADVPYGAYDGDGVVPVVEEPETLPVEDPGPADEPGCDGFSFTDPSSWAGAGICVMVKALRAIFYVLSDLLAAIGGIVGGLLDGIAALFMPDPQSFQDARDAMDFSDDPAITAWTDTLDGSDFFNTGPQAAQRNVEGGAAVPSMIPGVLLSGGCQGPGIDASALEMLGMEENLYPFNACSGAMATLAQWTRLLLMMFIGISGFLKIFEMIAVAIGAARQAQILGSFDWGNDHVVRKY